MKALLVDDERLARAALKRMLKPHDDVVVVGEAANTKEAASQIRQLHPDVIFLDVEMPGASGMDWLRALPQAPPIIFTTAYPDYAVQAFEVQALDYLVKPIATERLASALAKLRLASSQSETSPSAARKIFLRDGQRSWIVAIDRIRLLESQGNYTSVHFESDRALIYSSLNALESKLDPALFLRVSRAHIVNLREIASLEKQGDGALIAVLTEGSKIAVSRRKSRSLRKRLKL